MLLGHKYIFLTFIVHILNPRPSDNTRIGKGRKEIPMTRCKNVFRRESCTDFSRSLHSSPAERCIIRKMREKHVGFMALRAFCDMIHTSKNMRTPCGCVYNSNNNACPRFIFFWHVGPIIIITPNVMLCIRAGDFASLYKHAHPIVR